MAKRDEKSPPSIDLVASHPVSPAADTPSGEDVNLKWENLHLRHLFRQAQAIIDLQKKMIAALEGKRSGSE